MNTQNLNDLNTGDIILFASKHTWYDYVLRFFSKSKYTHVGIIIKNPKGFDEGIHIIESGIEPFPDELTNKLRFGVQMHKLQDVINVSYDCDIYYRKLQISNNISQHHILDNTIWNNILDNIREKPYDTNITDWFLAELRVLNIPNITRQQDKSFWCSALVSYIYIKLGLLNKNIPWSIICPNEWSDNGTIYKSLENCTLNNEIQIINK